VGVQGIYRFPASVARRCGQGLFCIYETPQADQPGHADILLTAAQFQDDKARKSATFDLGKELQPYFQTVDEYGLPALARIREQGKRLV
jgi:hypothetical protein